jgi:hypothetical protein
MQSLKTEIEEKTKKKKKKKKTETQPKTPSKTKNKSFTSAKNITTLHYTTQTKTEPNDIPKTFLKKKTYEIDALLLDLFQAKALVLSHFCLLFFLLSNTKKEALTLSPHFNVHILTFISSLFLYPLSSLLHSLSNLPAKSHTFFITFLPCFPSHMSPSTALSPYFCFFSFSLFTSVSFLTHMSSRNISPHFLHLCVFVLVVSPLFLFFYILLLYFSDHSLCFTFLLLNWFQLYLFSL